MGVDRERVLAESVAQDYVCGLSAHARQLRELFKRIRHLAAVLAYKPRAARLYVLCLVPVKIYGAYVLFKRLRGAVVLCRPVFPEERFGYLVYEFVGGLCG